MATEVLLVKEGFKLGAHDPISAETLAGIKPGEVVKATITRPRNLAFHRKFMALVDLVFKNQDIHATFKGLRGDITMGAGHKRKVFSTFNGWYWVPESISFSRMDQTDFDQLYDRAVLYILTEILPGLNRADLDREVELLLNNERNRI